MSARRKILVADLLCGAGGSSTGCARALADLGLEMELVCVNHWQVAIDTHKRNHPNARHVVQDIATVRPHLLVPEGRLDLLMASPTCTHHSVARGGKPTSDQQRSDPWHIITWLTELRVARIIIENVPEFQSWGPVDPKTMRPIKARKGEYFNAWIATLIRLGFVVEWRVLNAADYGDATTRRRFILMGRSDGKPIAWPQPTHFRRADGLALMPQMKPWRPAREIIDWRLKGKSIFARKRPLAPKTLARIYAGAVKFGWPEPYLVILRNHMDGRSIDSPVPTIAARGTHIGIVEPIILNRHSAPRGECSPVSKPAPTVSTSGGGYLVEPFLLSRHGEGAPRSTDEPTPTQVAKHSHALISPYYGSGSGETCKSVEQPLDTVTSRDRFGIAVPVTHAGGFDRARDIAEPMPTIGTGNRGGEALAEGVAVPVFDGVRYDILFRMLEPHELAAAMGFDADGAPYEFAGTKTEQIKQIGNAVSVAKMKACVGAIMADARRPSRAREQARPLRRAAA